MTRAPLSLLLVGALAGCSSIPAGRAPYRIADAASAVDLNLVLATPSVELTAADRTKGYAPADVVDGERLAEDLVAWLDASTLYRRSRATQASGSALADEAWGHADDLRLDLALTRFETTFDGHNAWWIPNILNWAFWMVPAWFVATEEYSVAFQARATLRTAGDGAVIHEVTLPVRVRGTFDEFDRGWQVLGFLHPFNDEHNWRQIARRLLPAASAQLGEALVRELATFHAEVGPATLHQRVSKTLALVVGVSSYPDPFAQPPLPATARAAEALARTLTTGNGLPPQHVRLLSGLDASGRALSNALRDVRARARPADQVVIYLACYGARSPSGEPVLLLADSEDAAAGWTLEALADELRSIQGEKLLILDTSFGQDLRGLAAPERATQAWSAAGLTSVPRLSLLVACGPGQAFSAPAGLDEGLFGHHLQAALAGQAESDGDGRLTLGELARWVERRTLAESAYFGAAQHPLVHLHPDNEFALGVTTEGSRAP